jgi:NADPH:quinone reductase-like Zn-dependent oxidoreductase
VDGESLLLVAGECGGGELVIQIAKTKRVHVAVVCSQEKCALFRNLGADLVIPNNSLNIGKLLKDASIPTFHVIIDTTLSRVQDFSSLKAQIQSAGLWSGGGQEVTFGRRGWADWFDMMIRREFGVDLFPRGYHLFENCFESTSNELRYLASLVEDGRLRIPVSECFDFSASGVHGALAAMMDGCTVGQIVVQITSEQKSDLSFNREAFGSHQRRRSVTFSDIVFVNGDKREGLRRRVGNVQVKEVKEEEEEKKKWLKDLEEEKKKERRS